MLPETYEPDFYGTFRNRSESFSCDWWLSESLGGDLSESAADVGYR